jgi:two-component system, OmpR family, sensor histidine kinase KdpD
MRDDEARPSPETLLKVAQAEEIESERAKLKIFLGDAAGVGKTYAMLEAAQQRRRDGRDVVAAYVESHGRAETDLLLEGLEVVPRARIEYQGVPLQELDLDAVLARRPGTPMPRARATKSAGRTWRNSSERESTSTPR